jgi:HAMP domain-containing protein
MSAATTHFLVIVGLLFGIIGMLWRGALRPLGRAVVDQLEATRSNTRALDRLNGSFGKLADRVEKLEDAAKLYGP